jgi:hypothetical protein
MRLAVTRLAKPTQRARRHAKARGIRYAALAKRVIGVVEPGGIEVLAGEVEVVVADSDHEGESVTKRRLRARWRRCKWARRGVRAGLLLLRT